MIQTPTLFRCETSDDQTLILGTNEIMSLKPIKDLEGNPYIMLKYNNLESCLNETVICKNIEIYNIE
jgi:hypothetical protein